eukprot:759673-Hanusia_phi.AAC.2
MVAVTRRLHGEREEEVVEADERKEQGPGREKREESRGDTSMKGTCFIIPTRTCVRTSLTETWIS